MQLHFFIDMPILNLSMQRLPEVVIIVFLAVHGSDTKYLLATMIEVSSSHRSRRAARRRTPHSARTQHTNA